MNRTGLIRLGGLAAVVGGVPYAAHGLVIVICTPNCPASLSSKTSVLFVLLLLGAMAAITALHALQRRLYGWAGAVASLTTFIGLTLTLVGGLGEVLATSPSARMADWYHLTGYFLFGGMLVAPIGSILLGVMTMGAGVLPWWGGVALIVGSPLLAFVIAPLGGAAWVLIGYATFRMGARSTAQASRVR